jgi:hypothetical protein
LPDVFTLVNPFQRFFDETLPMDGHAVRAVPDLPAFFIADPFSVADFVFAWIKRTVAVKTVHRGGCRTGIPFATPCRRKFFRTGFMTEIVSAVGETEMSGRKGVLFSEMGQSLIIKTHETFLVTLIIKSGCKNLKFFIQRFRQVTEFNKPDL